MEEKGNNLAMLEGNDNPRIIQINKRAIIVAVAVILILVIAAYVLTFVLPRGAYERDANGSIIMGTYKEDPALDGIEWWEFFALALPCP